MKNKYSNTELYLKNDKPIEIQTNDKDNISSIIDVLMNEYQLIHSRVFKQIAQYEDTNVKILMLLGVLLLFGISNFTNTEYYLFLYVNITFVIGLPIIAICSILLAVADLVKVMILGDYLIVIEDKVNNVLESSTKEYSFPRGHLLDWEYWRVTHGYAKGLGSLSEISFSVIIVVLTVFVSFLAAITRTCYIWNKVGYSYFIFFLISLIVISIVFILALILSVIIVSKRRKETKNNVKKKDEINKKASDKITKDDKYRYKYE